MRIRRDRDERDAVEKWLTQEAETRTNFLKTIVNTEVNPSLRMRECDWTAEVSFGRDRGSGLITAFAGVLLFLEPDAEDELDSAANRALPRDAVAVFFYRNGAWHWSGRTLFNMNPCEALERLGNQFDQISRPGN